MTNDNYNDDLYQEESSYYLSIKYPIEDSPIFVYTENGWITREEAEGLSFTTVIRFSSLAAYGNKEQMEKSGYLKGFDISVLNIWLNRTVYVVLDVEGYPAYKLLADSHYQAVRKFKELLPDIEDGLSINPHTGYLINERSVHHISDIDREYRMSIDHIPLS